MANADPWKNRWKLFFALQQYLQNLLRNEHLFHSQTHKVSPYAWMTTELSNQNCRFSPLFSCPGKKHKQDNKERLVKNRKFLISWTGAPRHEPVGNLRCSTGAVTIWQISTLEATSLSIFSLIHYNSRLSLAWITALTPPADLNEAKPSGFQSSSSPLLSGQQVCLSSLQEWNSELWK